MKFFKIFVSVLLALIMLTTPILAAPRRTKYVSDVIVAFGNTYEEAVQWLKSNGWSNYVEADLNKNSSSIFDKDRAVVIGYRTTYNVEEAITDLALMNMEGGYSYTSYDELIAKKKDDWKLFAQDFSAALQEYRTNYKNGNKKAIAAYNLLNEFIDDDTGKTVGTLFLNLIKEEMSESEYNALTNAERKEHADFTTMMLQGNAIAAVAIEQIVAMATDTNESTWLERLSEIGPDGLVDKYVNEQGMTTKQAQSEIVLDYSDAADQLLAMWEPLQTAIEVYESAGLTLESSTEEINEFFEKNPSLDIKEWASVASFYDKLAEMPYGEDETLLDLFTYTTEEMSEEEYIQLCTIASVFTPGQKSTFGFVSLAQLINYGVIGNDAEAWEQADKEAMEIADSVSEDQGFGAGSAEPISVYNGVDRSMFTGDIALTSDAKRKEARTDSSIYDGNMYGVNLVKLRNILFGVGIGCAIGAMLINTFVIRAIKHSVSKYLTTKFLTTEIMDVKFVELPGSNVRTSAGLWRKIAKGLNIASVVMCAAGLAVTIADLIQYYGNDFTPIPDRIVDEVLVEGTYETKYVFYKVAQCNRVEKYGQNSTLGSDNDLHADLGKVWLSLYYTKDKTAGKPITDGFVVDKSNNLTGYKPLHMFGEASPVNLSDPKWCYTDEFVDLFGAKGTSPIYVYYSVDNSASLVSSTFSTGAMALSIGGGILVGALVGFAISVAISKNKTKKEESN